MKRLARITATEHMSDSISHIIHIKVCNNIYGAFMPLRTAAIMAATDDTSIDEVYNSYSDEQLLQLSDEEIQSIRDVRLIERVAYLDRTRLSTAQLRTLTEELKKTKIIDKSDVAKIIEKLKRCNSISYEKNHPKTNRFLFDDNGNFREEDCLYILQHLEIEDYVSSTRSYNPNYLGHNLIVFEPNADWELSNGLIVEGLTIYVKLDVDETTGHTVALVSMHAANEVDSKPYGG